VVKLEANRWVAARRDRLERAADLVVLWVVPATHSLASQQNRIAAGSVAVRLKAYVVCSVGCFLAMAWDTGMAERSWRTMPSGQQRSNRIVSSSSSRRGDGLVTTAECD